MSRIPFKTACRLYRAKRQQLQEEVCQAHAMDAQFGYDGWDAKVWAAAEKRQDAQLLAFAKLLGHDAFAMSEQVFSWTFHARLQHRSERGHFRD